MRCAYPHGGIAHHVDRLGDDSDFQGQIYGRILVHRQHDLRDIEGLKSSFADVME